MKILKSLALLAVLAPVGAAYAGNYVIVDGVNADGNRSTLSYSKRSARRSGDQATAWFRIRYALPQTSPHGKSYRNVDMQIAFDCKAQRASVQTSVYRGINGVSIVDTTLQPSDWNAITPDSYGNAARVIACHETPDDFASVYFDLRRDEATSAVTQ